MVIPVPVFLPKENNSNLDFLNNLLSASPLLIAIDGSGSLLDVYASESESAIRTEKHLFHFNDDICNSDYSLTSILSISDLIQRCTSAGKEMQGLQALGYHSQYSPAVHLHILGLKIRSEQSQRVTRGLQIESIASLTLENIVMMNLGAKSFGGSVLLHSIATVTINSVVIMSSMSNNGGGISISSCNRVAISKLHVLDSFAANIGGGLLLDYCDTVEIIDSHFNSNLGLNFAGAVSVSGISISFAMERCVLKHNTAKYGSVIALADVKKSKIESSDIQGNIATMACTIFWRDD
jgi:hypothetical protein